MKQKLYLLTALFWSLLSFGQSWNYEGIENLTSEKTQTVNMSVDNNGQLYIAYRDATNSPFTIKIKKLVGDNWINVPMPSFMNSGSSYFPSIAFNSSNELYLAFQDAYSNSKTSVLKFNATTESWLYQGGGGISSSSAYQQKLTIDSNNNLYVAYLENYPNYDLTVKKLVGTSWQTLGTTGFATNVTSSPILKVGTNGTPYVAYKQNETSSQVIVKKFNGTSWDDVLDNTAAIGAGNDPDLFLDSNNAPYIVYGDATNGLKATVRKHNGTSWELVGNTGFSDGQATKTKIVLNSSNQPFVAFLDSNNGNKLSVKKLDGSVWVNVGLANSLAAQPSVAQPINLVLKNNTPTVSFTRNDSGLQANVVRYFTLPAAKHLNFDGVDDYVQIANSTNYSYYIGNQLTVEFWMKSSKTPDQWDAIIAKGDSSWRVALTSLGQIAFSGTNAFADLISPTSVTDGAWHHIAATYDGSFARIYIDGTENIFSPGSGIIGTNSFPISIGENLEQTGRFYNGNLADIRVWNTARNTTEIQKSATSNCGLSNTPTDLLMRFVCNQGLDGGDNTTISNLVDSSSHGFTGSFNGFSLNGASSNFIAKNSTGITNITYTATKTNATCNGANNGSIIITPSGGVAPYSYSWSNGSQSNTITNLGAGVYNLYSITDSNGCSIGNLNSYVPLQAFTITEPAALVAPTTTNQTLCSGLTISDLEPYANASIKWFADATTTTPLNYSTLLVSGTTYYVASTNANGCQSSRAASTVTLTAAPATPTIAGAITADFADINITATGICQEGGGLYLYKGTSNGKNKYESAFDSASKLAYDATNSKWILYRNTINNVLFENSTASSNLFPPATAWVGKNVCDALTMTITTIEYAQKSCLNGLASDLVPAPSDMIKWYDQAGYAVSANDNLSPSIYYVTTVNSSGCESARTAVSYSNFTKPTPPLVAGGNSDSSLLVTITGGCEDNSGYYYFTGDIVNGKHSYANQSRTPTVIEFNGINWQMKNDAGDILFENVTIPGFAPPAKSWIPSNTCSGSMNLIFRVTEQTLCSGATAADIVATGTNLVYFDDNLNSIPSTTVLTDTQYRVATVGSNGCLSEKIYVSVTITPQPTTPSGSATQTIEETNSTIANIVVSPNNVIWYATENDALQGKNVLNSNTILTNGTTYYAVNGVNACTSAPFAVTVTTSTLANDRFDSNAFAVYPNPTSGMLNIEYSKEIQQLSVWNVLGQLLFENKPNTSATHVDLSRLPAASYLVKVTADGKQKIIKVIKE